jgi:hypothetical protein
MNFTSLRRRLVIATTALLFVAGCDRDDPTGGTVSDSMTLDQASTRVEEIVREAQAALPPGIELTSRFEGSMPCDDPDDGGPKGRVFAERQYQVVYPAGWPVDQALPTVRQYWEQRGYKVIKDHQPGGDRLLSVENPADGFRIGIEIYARDSGRTDIFLVGSSPCVWEHGSPPA